MSKPQRVQRTRKDILPPNTIYVGRPTKWGNPYKIYNGDIQQILKKYRSWLITKLDKDPYFLDPLKGKNLACWCRLDKPCHADILLDLLSTINKEA